MDGSPDRPIRPHPDVVFRVLGDGAVLVNLANNRIFELNDTATAAWTRLVQGDSRDAIAAALTAEFDVDLRTAIDAINTLVADLARAELIES
jgi:hypothetical protein